MVNIRVGFGYDVHPLGEGRELWLGGIKLEFDKGCVGHSDADNTGRVLLPKPLVEYADISTDIKVLGSNNVIEIWDKKLYDQFLSQDMDIEKLAEDVLGNLNFNDGDDE